MNMPTLAALIADGLIDTESGAYQTGRAFGRLLGGIFVIYLVFVVSKKIGMFGRKR